MQFIFKAAVSVILLASISLPANADELADFMKKANLPAVKDVVETPAVKASITEDGIYHQEWFHESFFNMKDDFQEARDAGKGFVVVFEQRGCIYCKKMHEQVLSKKYINDYVRDNFMVVSLNLWGDREVTDFDGKVMNEKQLARRWGVIYTPTVLFFTDDLAGKEGKTGRDLVVGTIPGGFGPYTFFDMFVWMRAKGYETNLHFQKFHAARLQERGLF
jgi:thioredoxin-related protein